LSGQGEKIHNKTVQAPFISLAGWQQGVKEAKRVGIIWPMPWGWLPLGTINHQARGLPSIETFSLSFISKGA